MSGIDEGIPLCPNCVKMFGVSEGPTYWIGKNIKGNSIWLIHERFKMQATRYAHVGVIFVSNYDDIDARHFDELIRFDCGWTSEDRRNMLNGRQTATHTIREDDSLFKTLIRSYVYALDRDGGCFVS